MRRTTLSGCKSSDKDTIEKLGITWKAEPDLECRLRKQILISVNSRQLDNHKVGHITGL